MAEITLSSNLAGEADVSFTLDDVALKLTGFSIDNRSSRKLVITFISPYSAEFTVNAGKTLQRNITAVNRPSWTWKTINKGVFDQTFVDGIEWRVTLGV